MVWNEPMFCHPLITRFLSPLTGLFCILIHRFQGLAPLATTYRPLRGLPRRDKRARRLSLNLVPFAPVRSGSRSAKSPLGLRQDLRSH